MHEPTTEPRPGTAAWWLARENEPERPRRRRSLTLEGILDASLALLDERGAAALTMRNVAEELDCTQASLYRHVRNREELVTLLVDRAISVASAAPPEDADWAGKAAWSARRFREHLRRHPGVASLLRGTERLGPNSLAGMNYALGLFIGAGLSPRVAAAAASSLATFVIGSVNFNLGVDTRDPEESRHRRQLFRSRDASVVPLLVEHADTLADLGDDEFEVGLTALLTGFRALIEND
ncbi:TetR/AcrR family transcriptional regulator [Amycolatopsis umgeniensis]|uniref:AcrR family transcriptional regulator n=1 Tax=Amycolatopsis umgeniensis TaxID=336628 RepID=A0A841B8B2_9PSEU|nr:AcrR family transcriptional regulator [Amycolatopsis umgeniensis]